MLTSLYGVDPPMAYWKRSNMNGQGREILEAHKSSFKWEIVNDMGSSYDPSPRMELAQVMIQAQYCDW